MKDVGHFHGTKLAPSPWQSQGDTSLHCSCVKDTIQMLAVYPLITLPKLPLMISS